MSILFKILSAASQDYPPAHNGTYALAQFRSTFGYDSAHTVSPYSMARSEDSFPCGDQTRRDYAPLITAHMGAVTIVESVLSYSG